MACVFQKVVKIEKTLWRFVWKKKGGMADA